MANIVRKKRKKTNWVTADILDLYDKGRKLKKKRFETEGSEKCTQKKCQQKHQEVHEKGKRKLDREQCSEIEENLRKHNSKRVYQLVKDLTTVKQEKATTV